MNDIERIDGNITDLEMRIIELEDKVSFYQTVIGYLVLGRTEAAKWEWGDNLFGGRTD